MSNVTVTDSSCLRMDSRVPLAPLILFLQSYLQLLRECRGKLFVIMTSIVRLSFNRSYGQVGERYRESEVSCPRTQHNVPMARARTRTTHSGVERSNHEPPRLPLSRTKQNARIIWAVKFCLKTSFNRMKTSFCWLFPFMLVGRGACYIIYWRALWAEMSSLAFESNGSF